MQNPKLPSVTSTEMTMHELDQYLNQNNHLHPISVQDVSPRFSCPLGRHPVLLFYHNVTPGGPPNNALLTYREDGGGDLSQLKTIQIARVVAAERVVA